MWDCFEEALAVYKKECSNHKEMYRGMEKSIQRMEDEDARGSLMAALDYNLYDIKFPFRVISK